MDDVTWLAGRIDLDLLDAIPTRQAAARAQELGVRGVVVAPTYLHVIPDGLVKVTAVGYPTGRHHALVKAAEARLAVEYGAQEIWLTLDPASDANTQLAEVAAVRQSVPSVPVYVINGDGTGADGLIGRDIVRGAVVADEAVERLSRGAVRIAHPDPEALLSQFR